MRYTIISLVAGSLLVAAAAVAQPMIILYKHAGYTGESITYEGTVSDLRASRWNDKATSLRVIRGSWEICRHPGFGECELLFDGGTGELPNLNAVNWNDRISSLRAFQPPTEAQPPVSNQGTPGLQSAENFKISGRGVLALDASEDVWSNNLTLKLNSDGSFDLRASTDRSERFSGTYRWLNRQQVQLNIVEGPGRGGGIAYLQGRDLRSVEIMGTQFHGGAYSFSFINQHFAPWND